MGQMFKPCVMILIFYLWLVFWVFCLDKQIENIKIPKQTCDIVSEVRYTGGASYSVPVRIRGMIYE